ADRWAAQTDQRFAGVFRVFHAQIPCQTNGLRFFKD
ncbi:MAG: hypothetical protein ACI9HK_004115, partial [Pirellulaceae bacterium]